MKEFNHYSYAKEGQLPSDFDSYRPILLSSILVKLMERLVINRFKWLLETKELLHPVQASFQINRSMEEHGTSVSQSMKDNLYSGNIVCAVCIDFKGI